MLLLRQNLDTLERVVLFILGSSLISLKLISLMDDGRTSWNTATLRIIYSTREGKEVYNLLALNSDEQAPI